jgi:hypothetical protein
MKLLALLQLLVVAITAFAGVIGPDEREVIS